MNFSLTSFASWLERRLRRAKKSTGAVLGTGPGGAPETVGAPSLNIDDGRAV